jgi:hypothetical protein
MLRRWGRIFVAFATALAAWVVATPARADAPLCDRRGATTFAPAPQLQAPETSIDVGPPANANEESCFDRIQRASAEDGRAPTPAPPGLTVDSTVPNGATVSMTPGWVATRETTEVSCGERAGVRSRVDRPPRG